MLSMQLILSFFILILYLICLRRGLLDFDFMGMSLGLFSLIVVLINSKTFISYIGYFLSIESSQITIIIVLFGFLFLISLFTQIRVQSQNRYWTQSLLGSTHHVSSNVNIMQDYKAD